MFHLRVDVAELRKLLGERQMKPRDLQQATGLSKSFITYLANGKRNPSRTSASRLAQALGVPVEAFTCPRPVIDSAPTTTEAA